MKKSILFLLLFAVILLAGCTTEGTADSMNKVTEKLNKASEKMSECLVNKIEPVIGAGGLFGKSTQYIIYYSDGQIKNHYSIPSCVKLKEKE